MLRNTIRNAIMQRLVSQRSGSAQGPGGPGGPPSAVPGMPQPPAPSTPLPGA
jgi:hypothetical protein